MQQINPYEWVIFIKQGKPIEITTGFYLNSITEKVQFPDRSPRPQVSFNTLKIGIRRILFLKTTHLFLK